MTDSDRAYAAGFFDGEGCIVIAFPKKSKSGRRYHRLDVAVAQVDPRPLRWLLDLYGGRLDTPTPREKGRPVWHWRLNGPTAEAFLRSVRPYLIVKAEQADVAFEFRATVRRRTGGHKRSGAGAHAGWQSLDPVTGEVEQKREGLRKRLSGLKVVS